MKRYLHENNTITSDTYVVAMATINPQLCKKFGIAVEVEQRDEGPIPHLHVYWDSTRNPRKCSYIRLDKPEYSDHHGEVSKPLPKECKKQFLEIMNSEWPKTFHELADGTVKKATGYEAAVDTWVDTYENGSYDKFTLDNDGNLVALDYSTL